MRTGSPPCCPGSPRCWPPAAGAGAGAGVEGAAQRAAGLFAEQGPAGEHQVGRARGARPRQDGDLLGQRPPGARGHHPALQDAGGVLRRRPDGRPAVKSATPGPTGSSQIRKMLAKGDVESAQKDQIATGELGEYDTTANTVTLSSPGGGKVSVQQGPTSCGAHASSSISTPAFRISSAVSRLCSTRTAARRRQAGPGDRRQCGAAVPAAETAEPPSSGIERVPIPQFANVPAEKSCELRFAALPHPRVRLNEIR